MTICKILQGFVNTAVYVFVLMLCKLALGDGLQLLSDVVTIVFTVSKLWRRFVFRGIVPLPDLLFIVYNVPVFPVIECN